ncbi:MAG TPA: hypothetical protein VH415_11135 [Nitrososphaeraceae archaeon]
MKRTHSLISTILVATTVIAIITINVQVVSAPRTCGGCVEFKKLTHEFEKNVIGDPNIFQGPAPHLRELLDAYAQDVMRIFLGGPDTLPELLAQYQQDVLRIFEIPPPDGDKQAQHDQIKEFKQLTKAFEQGSINQLTAASIPPN